LATKIIVTDDITGQVIDPKHTHTIEIRVTSGDYAGASVELDLSTDTFEKRIQGLLNRGNLDKIFGGPERVSQLPVQQSPRPRKVSESYNYINTEIDAEDLAPEIAAQRVLVGQRSRAGIDLQLRDRVLRSGQVQIRKSFRLTNVTGIKARLDALGLDMVIDKTFRSVDRNRKVLGTFGDIYAVPKRKF